MESAAVSKVCVEFFFLETNWPVLQKPKVILRSSYVAYRQKDAFVVFILHAKEELLLFKSMGSDYVFCKYK